MVVWIPLPLWKRGAPFQIKLKLLHNSRTNLASGTKFSMWRFFFADNKSFYGGSRSLFTVYLAITFASSEYLIVSLCRVKWNRIAEKTWIVNTKINVCANWFWARQSSEGQLVWNKFVCFIRNTPCGKISLWPHLTKRHFLIQPENCTKKLTHYPSNGFAN